MEVTLTGRSWCRRKFYISSECHSFEFEYDGTGFGYETLKVNGKKVARSKYTWTTWYFLVVPHLEVNYAGHLIEVDIKVWPWLAIREFRLHIDGSLVFSEVPF